MAIREILRYPDNKLLNIAEKVESFDESVVTLAVDLRDTAAGFKAEGLAATQLGEAVRMFVIKDTESDGYLVCVNPEILERNSEEISSREGCLSFPGVYQPIKRSTSVRVRFQDENGQVVERWLSGINAAAFQHELDHLDGVLFIDRMGKLQKRLALKRLDKVRRKNARQLKTIEAMLNKATRAQKVLRAEENESTTVESATETATF